MKIENLLKQAKLENNPKTENYVNVYEKIFNEKPGFQFNYFTFNMKFYQKVFLTSVFLLTLVLIPKGYYSIFGNFSSADSPYKDVDYLVKNEDKNNLEVINFDKTLAPSYQVIKDKETKYENILFPKTAEIVIAKSDTFSAYNEIQKILQEYSSTIQNSQYYKTQKSSTGIIIFELDLSKENEIIEKIQTIGDEVEFLSIQKNDIDKTLESYILKVETIKDTIKTLESQIASETDETKKYQLELKLKSERNSLKETERTVEDITENKDKISIKITVNQSESWDLVSSIPASIKTTFEQTIVFWGQFLVVSSIPFLITFLIIKKIKSRRKTDKS